MPRTRFISLLGGAAAVALSAVTVAGCGGGGQATAATANPKTATGGAATIGLANNGSLGKILVDAQGHTLYLFQADSTDKSTCFGACAVAWPPLRVSGKPAVGTGLTASKVGTITRSDGKPQVTYNGHPVYLYQADQQAGQTSGQGINAFGGGWFVMSAAGNAITSGGSNAGAVNGY
jgi:predicted lipoprotein with Yx(FWY)xxD motif